MNPRPLTWEFLHFELCQNIGISQSHTWHVRVKVEGRLSQRERERMVPANLEYYQMSKAEQGWSPVRWRYLVFTQRQETGPGSRPTFRQIVKSIYINYRTWWNYTQTITYNIHIYWEHTTYIILSLIWRRMSL